MQYVKAIIALGSNIHPKTKSLRKALLYLDNEKCIHVTAISNFYKTTAVECVSQEPFINAVCEVETSLFPLELLKKMQAIETLLGKKEKPKHLSRTIDLDLLFFSNQTHFSPTLTIPHPKWKERLFVLIPLLDITKRIVVVEKLQTKEFDLRSLIHHFLNTHNEQVVLYEHSHC